MTINQMTYKQGQALAKFIHELRPDWDTPGIEDALGKARDMAPAADLAIAATKAAATATNRTPAVIALDGAHWRGGTVTPRQKFNPEGVCDICSMSEAECRRRWADDHEYEAVVVARRRRNTLPNAPGVESGVPEWLATQLAEQFAANKAKAAAEMNARAAKPAAKTASSEDA